MNQPRQDHTGDIDVFGELSPNQAWQDQLAGIAGDDQLMYNHQQAIGTNLSPFDDQETISEVVIRERLIEWLVGFLPGGPRADQAPL
jgi:hypothetical protein